MSKIDDKLNEVLGITEVDKTYENEVLPKKVNTDQQVFFGHTITQKAIH